MKQYDNEFAKLFENNGKQIVVMLQGQDDDPEKAEVRYFYKPRNLGVCSMALEFDASDAGWDNAAKVFSETTEEAAKLLAMCRTSTAASYLYPIVVIALNTGMRKGEILSLEWRMIDLKNGSIRLENTKNGDKRNVPLNNTVMEVLRSLPRAINDGKLFANTLHKWGAFDLAVRKAGIKDFHFHDLRHTFASWLVMAGANLTTIKELLGHRSITMTLRYAHLSKDHRAAAVRLLDKNNVTYVTQIL